ncbi:MAG TPA: hypothetical protein VE983_07805 [Solirubrobacteraceae bacterium]|nr:hypothetical protein [Solirubrobacteraceae bacterium]
MVKPPEDVNRMVRTVIEATDPAMRPVHKLRRFVVKRIEFVTTPLIDARPGTRSARATEQTSSLRK